MINRWKLYDLIYDKADRLLKQYNPCNIRIKDNVLVCNNKYMYMEYGEYLCCSGCEYLGEKGCTTKCLSCKTGSCWEGDSWKIAFNNNLSHISISKIFIHKMDKLKRIMYRYKLGGCRINKNKKFNKKEKIK